MLRARVPRPVTLLLPLAAILVAAPAGGDAPVGQYVLTTDTALDTQTGLLWQRRSSVGMPFTNALATCQTVQLDGQGGFRLPTIRELESLYDVASSTGPLWDKSVFSAENTTIGASQLWSATESGDHALVLSFVPTTGANMGAAPKDDYYGARCVKGP